MSLMLYLVGSAIKQHVSLRSDPFSQSLSLRWKTHQTAISGLARMDGRRMGSYKPRHPRRWQNTVSIEFFGAVRRFPLGAPCGRGASAEGDILKNPVAVLPRRDAGHIRSDPAGRASFVVTLIVLRAARTAIPASKRSPDIRLSHGTRIEPERPGGVMTGMGSESEG